MSVIDQFLPAVLGVNTRAVQAFGADGPSPSIVTAWPVGTPVWMRRQYVPFADEAYVKNAVAFRCIKMLSAAAAHVPLKLFRDDKEIDSHPIRDLIKHPAPLIAGAALWEAFYAYLLISGDTYIESVGPGPNRPPMELWSIRPDRIQIKAGARASLPQAYELQINGRWVKTWTVDQVTGMSDLLHLKEFNPLDDWHGQARVNPAAYGIDRHNAASNHNKALLDNGARPSGALIFKPVVKGTAVKWAPPDIIAAAEARLVERHAGTDKAGRPMVFSGDVDWKEMSISPKDMDFNEGKLDAARDICLAFGVPHILLVPGASTYNNVREARQELYEDGVLPMLDMGLSALNHWLVPRFDDRLELRPDLDAIPALAPRREAKRNATLMVWKSGLTKRNEARVELGLTPDTTPLGDEYCVPSLAGEEDKANPNADKKTAPPPGG